LREADRALPEALEQTFLDHERLSDASKRKILWDNALDFYRLPERYLPAEFAEAAPGG